MAKKDWLSFCQALGVASLDASTATALFSHVNQTHDQAVFDFKMTLMHHGQSLLSSDELMKHADGEDEAVATEAFEPCLQRLSGAKPWFTAPRPRPRLALPHASPTPPPRLVTFTLPTAYDVGVPAQRRWRPTPFPLTSFSRRVFG